MQTVLDNAAAAGSRIAEQQSPILLALSVGTAGATRVVSSCPVLVQA